MKTGCANISFFRESMNISFILLLFPQETIYTKNRIYESYYHRRCCRRSYHCARIRRVDEAAEIILLEKGKYISYANCGLPYYIGGVIEEREKLFVQTPEAFSTRFRVDVRTENEVIFIDRKRKTVTVRRSNEDTYQESYDKLLISTGASPVRPPLPGIDLNGIFTLRNVADTDRIKEYINTHAPRRAVVIGAGFIGLEMAENLHAQGAKVSIVEMGNQVMAPIDFSMASLVHQHLMEKE